MYNIPYIHNPIGSTKDQSDLYKDIGESGFRRILIQQMNDKQLNTYL